MAKYNLQDVLLEVWKPDIEYQLSRLMGFPVRFETIDQLKAWLREISRENVVKTGSKDE